jgi:hypothetical protein
MQFMHETITEMSAESMNTKGSIDIIYPRHPETKIIRSIKPCSDVSLSHIEKKASACAWYLPVSKFFSTCRIQR